MKYITPALLLFSFMIPQVIFAQGGLVTCQGPECNLCHVLDMANGLIAWMFGIAVLIAVIMIAYAGFLLVFSRGDSGAVSKGKSMLTNAIIGIIIMLAAFTIIDTFMKVFLGGEFGPWNKVEQCGGAFGAGVAKEGIKLEEKVVVVELESLEPDNPYGTGGLYAEEGPGAALISAPHATADGVFTYQSGISKQRGHASPALSSVLNCMAQKVPGGVGNISSISDSRIVSMMVSGKSQQEAFGVCVKGGCAHVVNSRHYGGSSHTGSSYAVDFGDEKNEGILCRAANECGRVYSCGIHNNNHVHLSLRY